MTQNIGRLTSDARILIMLVIMRRMTACVAFLFFLQALPPALLAEQPQRGIPGTYELNQKGGDPTLIPAICVGKQVYLRRQPTVYRSVSEIMQVRRTVNGAVETKSLPDAIKSGWVLCRSRKDAHVGVVVETLADGKFELVVPDVEDAAVFSATDAERVELEPLAKMRMTTAAKDWPAQAVIDAFRGGWQEKQWESMRGAMEARATTALGDKLRVSPDHHELRVDGGRVLLPARPTFAQLQLAEALSQIADPEVVNAIVTSSRHWRTVNRAQIEGAIAILKATPISPADALKNPDLLAKSIVELGVDPNTGVPRRVLLLDARAGTAENLRRAIEEVRSLENAPAVVVTRGKPGEKERLAGIVGDTGPTQILLHRPSLEMGTALDPKIREAGLIGVFSELTGATTLGAKAPPQIFVPQTRVVVIDREFLPALENSIKNGEFANSHIWALVCPIDDADLLRLSSLALDPAVGKALSFTVTAGKKEQRFSTVTALAIVAHLAEVGFTPWGGETRLDCVRRFYQFIDQKIEALRRATEIPLPAPGKGDQEDADRLAKQSVMVVLETRVAFVTQV